MATASQAAAPPAATKPRRRWLRVLGWVIAVVVLVPLALVAWISWKTHVDWAAAEAETDALDPRWRLADLEADRAPIPDAENAALQILAATRLVRTPLVWQVRSGPNYQKLFKNVKPTPQLNVQQLQLIRIQLNKLPPAALAAARKLKDMPRGQFPVAFSLDFIRTHLPIHEAYEVADWLKHDAYLATHDGRGDDAIEECRAILNVGRALGDDRGFFSHRTRVGMQWGCKHTAERVLGQGTASDESLAALQDLLTREAAESNWLHVLRGERAGHHHLFENVRTGKVAIFEMLEPEQEPVDVLAVAMQVVPVCMLPYYPEHLRTMNRAIEIARLPLHEQKAKLTALDQEVAAQGGPLAGRLLGKFVKIWESECRSQAIVRTHLVALACERYRLKHANWPAALEVLVKEKYLAAVPCDPFDGEPLRYRLEEDCVAVYSIGIDAKDDHGQTDHNPFERAPDIGFRLWNESHRRAAPQPPVVLPEGNRQP